MSASGYELWRCVEGQVGLNEWMVYGYNIPGPVWFVTEDEARAWIAARSAGPEATDA